MTRFPLPVLSILLVTFLTATLLMVACSPDRKTPEPDTRADVSGPVREAARLTRQFLAEPAPAGPAADAVCTMRLLGEGLADPSTSEAARDSFFTRWEASVRDPLAIQFALSERRRLKSDARIDSLLERAIREDTTKTLALLLEAWEDGAVLPDPDQRRKLAPGPTDGAEPTLREYFLRQRWATRLTRAGEYEQAIGILTGSVPSAWRLAGAELLGPCWLEVARAAMPAGRLGDADLAVAMARQCADRTEDRALRTRLDVTLGRVFQEMGRYTEADSLFELCHQRARSRDDFRGARRALSRRTLLAYAVGDIRAERESSQRILELDTAARDTGLMVFDLAYLGNALRREGRLDQADSTFSRGYALAEAYKSRDVSYWLDRFRALLMGQLGRYDEAEFLLERYARHPASGRNPLTAFAVQMVLLEQALEQDHPDVAYRALKRAEELLPQAAVSENYDPVLELRMVSAKLHARQGELHLADADVAVIETRLEGATPISIWYATEARARVADLSGDRETAEGFWKQCLAVADSLGNPDLQARSRVRLAASLLEAGRPDEVADLVAPGLDAPEYWTRLNATVITGLSQARAGRDAEAMAHFAAAEELLAEGGPADIAARLALEKGRLLVRNGQQEEAWAAFCKAHSILTREQPGPSSDLGLSFNQHIRREVTEALLTRLLIREGNDGAQAARELAAWGRGDLVLEPAGPTLEYFVGPEAAFCWIGDAAGNWVWQDLAPSGKLRRLVMDVLVDTGFPDRPVDRKTLQSLGRELLPGLEAAWPAGKTLHLIPDGFLHALPWAALPLPDSGMSLLHHGPLVFATPTNQAERKAKDREDGLLAVASNRHADPDLEGLRQAEAEARAVAAMWPGEKVDLVLGEGPDFQGLFQWDLKRYRALHIASHTRIFAGQEGHSAIHLAGGGAVLTLDELRAAEVPVPLVYLSSCEGSRRDEAGGSGVAGFAQAFLAAGAQSVIATSVLVDDSIARRVAEGFYGNWLPGQERAAALRAALLDIADEESAFSHPFHWGYFRLHEAGAASVEGRDHPSP